jgi:uncharacterized membrane protein
VLEEQLLEKEDAIIQRVLSQLADAELKALISLVAKTGGNGALLNNDAWMLAELTPDELEVRHRYTEQWYEMGGW